MWVCRLLAKRRNPLSAKGSAAYDLPMADIDLEQFLKTPGLPLSVTVAEHSDGWYVRVWYAGRTISEMLKPYLVAEQLLSAERTPAGVTVGVILQEAAIALSDLGMGRRTTVL